MESDHTLVVYLGSAVYSVYKADGEGWGGVGIMVSKPNSFVEAILANGKYDADYGRYICKWDERVWNQLCLIGG